MFGCDVVVVVVFVFEEFGVEFDGEGQIGGGKF